MHPEPIKGAVLDPGLCPLAAHVVHPDVSALAERRPVARHASRIAQLVADDGGVDVVPEVVADGAPVVGTLQEDLHAPHVLVLRVGVYQSDLRHLCKKWKPVRLSEFTIITFT